MNSKNSHYWMREEKLNLTPLLDTIFILIFFFLFATTLREEKERLGINLPTSTQNAITETPQEKVYISVTNANKIYLEDSDVTIPELVNKLKPIAEKKKDTEIIIKGDAKAYNQTIVNVLDACSEAGLSSVSIEVKKQN